MAVTLVVALVLSALQAIPKLWLVVYLFVATPCLALIVARRLVIERQRQAAAIWFGVVATSINVLYAALCICPDSYLLTIASLASLFMVIPVIVSFGAAWVILATRQIAVRRRAPEIARISVLALAVAPLATLLSLWPLHLYFLFARPAMEQMADQAAAGLPFGGPTWIGVVRVQGADVNPRTGEVALFCEPNRSHPAGFVRAGTTASAGRGAPTIAGSNLKVNLGYRWSYREDD